MNEVESRACRNRAQFSLRLMLLVVAIVAGVCGGYVALYAVIRKTQLEAHLAAQRSELRDIGASFTTTDASPYMITELRFDEAMIDEAWLQKRLRYWEYSFVKSIRVLKGQLSQDDLARLKLTFPQIKFCEVSEEDDEG